MLKQSLGEVVMRAVLLKLHYPQGSPGELSQMQVLTLQFWAREAGVCISMQLLPGEDDTAGPQIRL